MLGFFKDIISGGAAKLVEATGKAIDSIVTSDEERLALKLEMQKEINGMELAQIEAGLLKEVELTDRHANDMKSDSWLSKNVRPMVLIFLTVTLMGLAYSTIFSLDTEDVVLLQPWITLLTTLLMTVYTFYFGSRGLEKAISMVQQRKEKRDAIESVKQPLKDKPPVG